MVRLTDRPDMTLDVYRGRKTTIQQHKKEDFSLLKTTLKGSGMTDRSILPYFEAVYSFSGMTQHI